MNTLMIIGFGLAGLGTILWRFLRGRVERFQGLPPVWLEGLGRMSNDQALGHHRDARRKVLVAIESLERDGAGSVFVHHAHISLAALLAKDPLYPEVVRTIRATCAVEPAMSEMALCLRLGDFLVEDIRQCAEIAERLGQIRRRDNGTDALLIARFQTA